MLSDHPLTPWLVELEKQILPLLPPTRAGLQTQMHGPARLISFKHDVLLTKRPCPEHAPGSVPSPESLAWKYDNKKRGGLRFQVSWTWWCRGTSNAPHAVLCLWAFVPVPSASSLTLPSLCWLHLFEKMHFRCTLGMLFWSLLITPILGLSQHILLICSYVSPPHWTVS